MVKQEASTKIIHAVKPPFSEPTWPLISPSLESSILEHLLPLLSPIGTYRRDCIAVSKGRGRKKSHTSQHVKQTPSSQEPQVLKSLTVGFNSTVRSLESLAQKARLATQSSRDEDLPLVDTLSAVFVCVTDLPDVMISPLSLLVATASLNHSADEAIRLVPITPASSQQLSEALHQPMAKIVGIMKNTPGSDGLNQLLKTHVDPVDVPWIREAASEKYLPVNIQSEVVKINSKPNKLQRKQDDD